MNHGGGDDAAPRSRRRRHDTDAPEGLSVADLLARHGVAAADGAASNRHRLEPPAEAERPPAEPPPAHGAEPTPPTQPAEPPTPPAHPAPPSVQAEEPPQPPEPEPPLPRRDRPDTAAPDPTGRPEPAGTAPGRVTAEPPPAAPSRPPEETRTPPWGDAGSGFTRGFTLPPHPSANLFAQLGKAEPDDSPTQLVPRIPADDTHARREPEPQHEPDKDAPEPADETPKPADEDERGFELRTRRIDESLTRLTAIHAGLGKEMTERVSRTRGLPVVDPASDQPPHGPQDHDADEPTAPGPAWLRRATKGVALAAALAVVLAVAAGWGTRTWLDGKLRTVAALDPGSEAIVDPVAQAGDQNYLLVGLDPSNAPPPPPRGPIPGVLPTAVPGPDLPPPLPNPLPPTVRPGGPDTIMLAHVPARRDRVVLLAFPGDLAVDRPSCDRWNQAAGTYPGGTSPAQAGAQLASTYTVGGPRCVTKTIQKLTGLAVNHYADIDLAALKDMVDAVHGVPICLPSPVVDAQLGPVVPESGETVLAGDQALAFARAQHVQGDPTPVLGQIQRQQLLLTALLRKAGSDQVLTNVPGLTELVTAFGGRARVDNSGLEDLSTLADSLRSVDPAKISFAAVPAVPAVGQPDVQGNEPPRGDATAAALFDAIRAKRPLPTGDAAEGRAANQVDTGTLPPRAVTVHVRNGSARRGLGNLAADSLRTLGFVVASVGDAPPSPGGRTVIRHSPDRADQAAALAAAVPAAVTEAVPGASNLLELVLGEGFDGQVRAAPTAGPGTFGGGPHVLTAAAASCG